MRRAMVETVDGEAITRYVNCGAGRARPRGSNVNQLTPMQSGVKLPDFLFAHPAALVSKSNTDKNSR